MSSSIPAAAAQESLLLKKTPNQESDPLRIQNSKKRNRVVKEIASFPYYRGVRQRTWGSYVSEIRIPKMKTRIWLGSFDSPEMAARAYDSAAFYLKGESASLNFPDLAGTLPRPYSSTRKDIQIAAAKAATDDVILNRNENRFELDCDPMKDACSVSGSKENEQDWWFLDDELAALFDDVFPFDEQENKPVGSTREMGSYISSSMLC